MIRYRGYKIKQGVVIATLLIGLVSTAQAGNYSNIYFYGGSLTDSGIYRPILSNGYDHFSTNPGTVWSQNLGAAYGFTVSPAYAAQPNTSPVGFSPSPVATTLLLASLELI